MNPEEYEETDEREDGAAWTDEDDYIEKEAADWRIIRFRDGDGAPGMSMWHPKYQPDPTVGRFPSLAEATRFVLVFVNQLNAAYDVERARHADHTEQTATELEELPAPRTGQAARRTT